MDLLRDAFYSVFIYKNGSALFHKDSFVLHFLHLRVHVDELRSDILDINIKTHLEKTANKSVLLQESESTDTTWFVFSSREHR